MVIFETKDIEDIKNTKYDKRTIQNIFFKIIGNRTRSMDEVQELEKAILSYALKDIPSNIIAVSTAGLYDNKGYETHGAMVDYRDKYGKISIHLNIDDELETENFSGVVGSIAGINHEVQHVRQLLSVEKGKQDIATLIASLEVFIMYHGEVFSEYYKNNWDKFYIEENADRNALKACQEFIEQYLEKKYTIEELQDMLVTSRYTTIKLNQDKNIVNRIVDLINKIKEYNYLFVDPFYKRFHLESIMDSYGRVYSPNYFLNQYNKTKNDYYKLLYDVSLQLELNNDKKRGTI